MRLLSGNKCRSGQEVFSTFSACRAAIEGRAFMLRSPGEGRFSETREEGPHEPPLGAQKPHAETHRFFVLPGAVYPDRLSGGAVASPAGVDADIAPQTLFESVPFGLYVAA